jgi:equilibrative nucleoside transporter 1/2/3
MSSRLPNESSNPMLTSNFFKEIAIDNGEEIKDDDEDDPAEVQTASYMIVSLGIGYLFPFSALTQPVDYWQTLFPQWNIEFPITAVFMWSNLLVLICLGNCYKDLSSINIQYIHNLQFYLEEHPLTHIALLAVL